MSSLTSSTSYGTMRPSTSGPSWRQTRTVILMSSPSRPLRASSSGLPRSLAGTGLRQPCYCRNECLLARSSTPDQALRYPTLRRSLVRPLLHLDVLVHQRLLVQDRAPALARELPGRHVGELVVVAQRLAVGGLRLRAEVATTGFASVQRIDAHELAQLQEVGDPPGPLEGLVEALPRAQHPDVRPELAAQLTDPRDRLAQALLGPLHAAVVPHDVAELLVEGVDRPAALHRQQPVDSALDRPHRLGDRRVRRVDLGE